jgi:hypothetical protein
MPSYRRSFTGSCYTHPLADRESDVREGVVYWVRPPGCVHRVASTGLRPPGCGHRVAATLARARSRARHLDGLEPRVGGCLARGVQEYSRRAPRHPRRYFRPGFAGPSGLFRLTDSNRVSARPMFLTHLPPLPPSHTSHTGPDR